MAKARKQAQERITKRYYADCCNCTAHFQADKAEDMQKRCMRADVDVERYGKAKNAGRGEGVQKIIGRRRHKYHAKKCEVDGIVFDSHKEAKRYRELKLLQRAGKISDLTLQPEFILQDGFERDGKRYRAIKYVADFQYVQDGKLVVEDTKGYRTKEYLIKRKMFLKNYPEIEFREL